MRSKLLPVAAILLVGLGFWWLRPVVNHATSFKSSHLNTTSLSSTLPSSPDSPPAPATVVKPVGVHSGPPMPFHPRQTAGQGHDISPMQRYSGLKLSAPVKINERSTLILAARGVPEAAYNSSFGPVLFEQSGFAVVAMDITQDNSWQDLIVRSQDRPLVVNPANGQLGIVTGTLIVQLENSKDADKLGARENLQLLHVDEAISTAYYRAPENYGLYSGADRLRQTQGVVRVELEVVAGRKVLQ